jgi:hypothetical protein
VIREKLLGLVHSSFLLLRESIMADGLGGRNADERQRLLPQRAQRAQRKEEGQEGAILLDLARIRGAEILSAPRLIRRLLEVENIQDNFCLAIAQYDVASDYYAFAIAWRRGKAALQVGRNHVDPTFKSWRKRAAEHKLLFQSGRQAIFLGEARREVCVMFCVPAAKFVTVMRREAVAAAIVIVVIVFVRLDFAPMPVSVVVAAILVVLVFIREGGGSWKHEES